MENQSHHIYRKCTICGKRKLPKSNLLLSSFPLDPDRCRLWVKATGDEDLVHVPIEKLHELKFLCASHFAPECFNKKGSRLLKTAVPTERLINPPLSDDCFKEFPLHVNSFYDKEKNKSEYQPFVMRPSRKVDKYFPKTTKTEDTTICSICLRTNVTVNSEVSEELLYFYDELLEIVVNPSFTFCESCEQSLKKCYDFKMLCQKSNKVLQEWRSNNMTKTVTENLHHLIQSCYNELFGIDNEEECYIESEPDNLKKTITKKNNVKPEEIVSYDNKDPLQSYDNIMKIVEENDIVTETVEENGLTEFKEETDCEIKGIGNSSYNYYNENVTQVDKIDDCSDIVDNDDKQSLNTGDDTKEGDEIENYSDNEDNEIGNSSFNENNEFGDNSDNEYGDNNDTEYNEIGDESDNENEFGDNSDSENYEVGNNNDGQNIEIGDDDDRILELLGDDEDEILYYSDNEFNTNFVNNSDNSSDEELENINKLLKKAKNKTIRLKVELFRVNRSISVYKNIEEERSRKIKEMKERWQEYKKAKRQKTIEIAQQFEDIFDIEYFNTDEEAKAELLSRPDTEYYKNAEAKCTLCYLVFKSQATVDFHMKKHQPEAGEYVCDICGIRCKHRGTLSSHKSNSHFGKCSCKMCPLITYTKCTMEIHARRHQGVKYQCKLCDKIVNHKSAYYNHINLVHGKQHAKQYECPLCSRTYKSSAGLTKHRQSKHKTKGDVETEGPVKREQRKVHNKKHTETSFLCSHCGDQFTSGQALGLHRRHRHPGEITVLCGECGARGSTDAWLYRHRRAKHLNRPGDNQKHDNGESDNKKERVLCDQCGIYVPNLKTHSLKHTNERPFPCQICGSKFKTKLQLRDHMDYHKPRSHVCTVCDRKFYSKTNLYTHMKIHIGDRRYKCTLCDKRFLNSNAMKQHVKGVHLQIRRERKDRSEKRPKKKKVVVIPITDEGIGSQYEF